MKPIVEQTQSSPGSAPGAVEDAADRAARWRAAMGVPFPPPNP